MAFGANLGVSDASGAGPNKMAAKPAGDPSDNNLSQDPQAVQCIDYLKSKGYSPEEVADAMSDHGERPTDNQSLAPSGASAAKAAPLQIPGM